MGREGMGDKCEICEASDPATFPEPTSKLFLAAWPLRHTPSPPPPLPPPPPHARSQNSELVALGTVGTAVHVYDLFTGHHASSFVLPARHASKGTKQLQFLPDNDTLACLT